MSASIVGVSILLTVVAGESDVNIEIFFFFLAGKQKKLSSAHLHSNFNFPTVLNMENVSPSQIYRKRKPELQVLAKQLGINEAGLKRNELADQIREKMLQRNAFQDVTNSYEEYVEEIEEEEEEDKENTDAASVQKPTTSNNSFFGKISTLLPPYKTMDAMIDLELKA
jgi:predicted DNA-binding protein YlxM (UPF0122 family)